MAHANEPTKGATDPAAKDPVKVDEINMEGLQDRKSGKPERLHIDPNAAGPVSDQEAIVKGLAVEEYAVHAEGLELIITLHDDQLQQVVIKGEAASIMVAGNYPGWALKLCREYTDESGRLSLTNGSTDKFVMPADDMGLESFDVMQQPIPAAGPAGEYDHYAETELRERYNTEAGAGADEARADAIIATKLIRYLSDQPNLIESFKGIILEEIGRQPVSGEGQEGPIADQLDHKALERAAKRIGVELFGEPIFAHLSSQAVDGKENPFHSEAVTQSVEEMTKAKAAADQVIDDIEAAAAAGDKDSPAKTAFFKAEDKGQD